MRLVHDLGNLAALLTWGSGCWVIWKTRCEQRQDEQTRRDRVFARQHRVRRPLW